MKDVLGVALICVTICTCVAVLSLALIETAKSRDAYKTACLEKGGNIDGWTGNCVP